MTDCAICGMPTEGVNDEEQQALDEVHDALHVAIALETQAKASRERALAALRRAREAWRQQTRVDGASGVG